MRKRYYLIFVARDADGQLLKVPIPLHYLYIFIAGAVIGMFTITGMAGSYTRMLFKVARFNQLRSEKEALKKNYNNLEQVSQAKEIQVASLSSLASEVTALYGLKTDQVRGAAFDDQADDRYRASLDTFYDLRSVAMSGAASIGMEIGVNGIASTQDLYRLAAAPAIWPVVGRVTAAFGERQDPFSGEGEFHAGIDISAPFGDPVRATSNGVVERAESVNGYGREIVLDHGYGFETLYGHLASFAVTAGERVTRGQIVGYVGLSGRSTGPHLHYEVRINNTPVNPYKFLQVLPSSPAMTEVYGSP